MGEWFAGFLTGFMTMVMVSILFMDPPKSYLVKVDNAKVQIVSGHESRGKCLEKLEQIYKDGPVPQSHQCVDRS